MSQFAYYKPEGVFCTRHDPSVAVPGFRSSTKIPWFAFRFQPVAPDANTSGLLLFITTGQGKPANRLMHPSRQVEREYLVRVFGEVTEQKVKNVTRGVQPEDGMARFEDVVYAGGEGMNHTFT
ncbi:pseudouridine synthase [Vibrio lentus]|nr:pseudouridine synthase [Vibrio lentus]